MTQEIITYTIITSAICIVIYSAYSKFIRKSTDSKKCHGCSGCGDQKDSIKDISEECDSQQIESNNNAQSKKPQT